METLGLSSGYIGRTTPLARLIAGAGGLASAVSERTPARVAAIAARGLSDPAGLSGDEIRAMCGAALTQALGRR